jgi:hypothetical protein
LADSVPLKIPFSLNVTADTPGSLRTRAAMSVASVATRAES